jgi:cobalamin biosynthesis Mg chelatase CobN
MRRLNPLIALLAALIVPLGCLMAATPAMASDASAIYKECEQNGQITGNFTRAELKAALNGLPSEVSEYSDCQDLIQQALVRTSTPSGPNSNSSTKSHLAGGAGSRGGGNGGKGSSGGTAGTTGSSRTKNGKPAVPGSDKAVTLAGSDIRPGSTGTSASSSLPVALIVVLILLALTAVSGGAVALRRRVDAGHST